MDCEFERSVDKISEMKEKLIDCLLAEMNQGIDTVDTEEAYKVVDMIKDFAEAEKYHYETEYYETVIEAMGEKGERYGYDRYRYANGRFAPKGRGRKGYMPYIDQEPYIYEYVHDPMFEEHMRGSSKMGYSPKTGLSTHMQESSDGDGRYGKAYNDYKLYKRYYSESKSPAHKSEMDEHAMEHMTDTMTSLREIWKTADTDFKKKMKQNLSQLVGEMQI